MSAATDESGPWWGQKKFWWGFGDLDGGFGLGEERCPDSLEEREGAEQVHTMAFLDSRMEYEIEEQIHTCVLEMMAPIRYPMCTLLSEIAIGKAAGVARSSSCAREERGSSRTDQQAVGFVPFEAGGPAAFGVRSFADARASRQLGASHVVQLQKALEKALEEKEKALLQKTLVIKEFRKFVASLKFGAPPLNLAANGEVRCPAQVAEVGNELHHLENHYILRPGQRRHMHHSTVTFYPHSKTETTKTPTSCQNCGYEIIMQKIWEKMEKRQLYDGLLGLGSFRTLVRYVAEAGSEQLHRCQDNRSIANAQHGKGLPVLERKLLTTNFIGELHPSSRPTTTHASLDRYFLPTLQNRSH